MKKITLFMALIVFCSWQVVLAQKTITGTVTDSKDGSTLPGVSISVKGTTNGTISDISGKYSIKVSEKQVLVFSFVGYNSQEVTITSQAVVDIAMVEQAAMLDQVVVVGYGTQKKSDLTGSIAIVGAKELSLGGTVNNAAQALQGKTSGVQVTQNSRAPGGSLSIRIRGANSIASSNEPLYIVDGFPSANGADINPNDIENLTILKDASAAAIYGARGANGVVVITTKRGVAGQSHLTYTGSTGIQNVVNPFEMLDGQQYMNLANALYSERPGKENVQYGLYTQSQLQSTVNTDWIAETTRTGVVQDHNIQFTGGTENTKVMASLGYFGQQGVLENTSYSRISARVNIDQTISKYVKAGVNMTGLRGTSNFQEYGGNILQSNVLLGILNYDPTVPAYNADGTYGRPPGGKGDNPLANLLSRENQSIRDRYYGNMYFLFEPLKGLTARINGGVEISNNFAGTYLPRSTYQGGIDNGVASQASSSSTRSLFDAVITYTKTIENNNFSIMGGYAYENTVSRANRTDVKGFSTDVYSFYNLGAASTITGVSSSQSESLLISWFGRLNYSFKDKYLATFTLRDDGSSRFGEDYRHGLFPSGSIAWKMDQEDFIKNLNVFSSLKLRAGYGSTGNDQVGNYASYALMSNTHLTWDGQDNTSGTHLNNSSPENSQLRWETTAQFDAGLDMGFFNSRLLVTFDLYYKNTSDLLLRKSLPLYSGFVSGISNVAETVNKGLEFQITSRNLTGKLQWTTTTSLSMNRNNVSNLPGGKDIYITSSKPMGTVSEEAYAVIREGESLGSLFGYIYEGPLQTGEVWAPQPTAKPGDPKFRDISGPNGVPDGKITSADRTIIGQAYPKFMFGMTNTFNYSNWDFSFFFYGNVGSDMLNMTRMNLEWNRTTDALDRWTSTNTETDLPRNGFYYLTSGGGYTNSHFIEDASFLRMKTINLGYTLPKSIKFVSSCRIYFLIDNLFTITNYTGWDPEVDTKGYETGGAGQTANAGAGLDFNAYPALRAYSLGLNITF
jgi:TonB-dependent starch-binding outer membrane protein SusC